MIEFLTAGQAPASCPGSSEPQALPLPPSSLGYLPAAASGSHVAGRPRTELVRQDRVGRHRADKGVQACTTRHSPDARESFIADHRLLCASCFDISQF